MFQHKDKMVELIYIWSEPSKSRNIWKIFWAIAKTSWNQKSLHYISQNSPVISQNISSLWTYFYVYIELVGKGNPERLFIIMIFSYLQKWGKDVHYTTFI